MKKLLTLLLLLFALGLSNTAIAQVIAEFDRANTDGCVSSATPTFTVADLTATELCRGSGLTHNTAGGDYNSRDFDTSNASAADAEADDEQLTFSITPAAGSEVIVTQLNVRMDRSGTGPTDYEIRVFADGMSTTISTGVISSAGGNFLIPLGAPIASTGTVAFQILAWGASSSSGTMDIEGNSFGATNTLADPGIQILGQVNAVLPVELTDFTAENMEDKAVVLNWTTASEEENHYFVVEHSDDGTEFEEVELIKGNGTTYDVQNYSFMHEFPRNGNNYYRLRQVDYDGTYSYSGIRVVTLKLDNVFSFQPTIAKDYVNVTLSERFNDNTAVLMVFDLSGRMVMSEQIAANNFTRLDVS
ncbi:MAG: hypothetical protein AAGG75_28360, partial [Bacteroidota bacterium]